MEKTKKEKKPLMTKNEKEVIREMIENGVPPVLLQAIVKSLIRFEREMVINFTDNTVVLDVEYYQFCFMG